jgi:hypothetical protein
MTDETTGDLTGSEDEARSPIGEACGAALELAAEKVEEHGGKVLAGFLMLHVDGLTPSAGLEDMLAFLISGVSAFAQRSGLPFRVMQMDGGIGAEG